MKYLILFCLTSILVSCSSTKTFTYPKNVYIQDLVKKNQVYMLDNNSYHYFMIDSLGDKHLIRMNFFNNDKVLWTEKLNRIR